jgi:hypothetical protein
MIDPLTGYGLHGGEMLTPKPKTGFGLGYQAKKTEGMGLLKFSKALQALA